jgi:hypothetical protein
MPEPATGSSAALTAAQFAEFKARKEAAAAAAAATAAAAAAEAPAQLSGRELWNQCPGVFDVDEEGRPSAAALAAAAAEASLEPKR